MSASRQGNFAQYLSELFTAKCAISACCSGKRISHVYGCCVQRVRSSRRKTKVIELNPVPHYISEDKSEMRGIKSGWYAMDHEGNLVSGPFVSCEKCVERIVQPTKRPTLP